MKRKAELSSCLNKHQRQLMSWFASLTVEDRLKATTIDSDPQLVSSILTAYAKLTNYHPTTANPAKQTLFDMHRSNWGDEDTYSGGYLMRHGNNSYNGLNDFALGSMRFMHMWNSDNYDFLVSSFPDLRPLSIDWCSSLDRYVSESTLINAVSLSWSMLPSPASPSLSTTTATTSSTLFSSSSSLFNQTTPPSQPSLLSPLLTSLSQSSSFSTSSSSSSSSSSSLRLSSTSTSAPSVSSTSSSCHPPPPHPATSSSSSSSSSAALDLGSFSLQSFSYSAPDVLSLHPSFVTHTNTFFKTLVR